MAKDKPSTNEPTEGAISELAAPVRGIVVTAAAHRRRAGISFGPEPTVLTEADLEEDKVKILLADPLLSIRPYVPPAGEANE